MCKMAYMVRLQTTVIARSEATKQSIFAAPWIASLALAMTEKRQHAYPFPLPRMKSKSQPSSACRMVSLNKYA